MTTTWLIDKSAYARLGNTSDAELWMRRIGSALVHIATVTRLEVGFSLRNADDLDAEEVGVLAYLVPTYSPPRAEDRAVDVQRALTARGEHRAPSVADLLVAATAETQGHTVLHVDKDFDLIAQVTGQPVERLR